MQSTLCVTDNTFGGPYCGYPQRNDRSDGTEKSERTDETMKKRLVSILLTVCLLAGLLPCMTPLGRADGNILDHIEITMPPTKTEYIEGHDFERGGMVVVAVYSDGTPNKLLGDDEYTVTPETNLQLTDTYVTVSYTEGGVTKTAQQAITVVPAAGSLVSIAVTTTPQTTGYAAGMPFDPTGMVVTATYTDGSTRKVTNYTYEPSGPLQTTDTYVTIYYTESGVTRTTTQAITVNAAFVPTVGGVASLGMITVWWNVETNMTKSELQRRVRENNVWSDWATLSSELTEQKYEDLDVKDRAEYQYRVRGYYNLTDRWCEWGTSSVISYVAVQSVSLNKTELPLVIGQQAMLTATVYPEDASEKRVEWHSDNYLVAEVNADGLVTAHAVGTVNITATTLDGNKTATCKVTVKQASVWVSGSVKDTVLTYNVAGAPANAMLIAAWYDGYGRLLGTARTAVAAGDTTDATLTVAAGAMYYKLMLVDKTSFAPQCIAAFAKRE